MKFSTPMAAKNDIGQGSKDVSRLKRWLELSIGRAFNPWTVVADKDPVVAGPESTLLLLLGKVDKKEALSVVFDY